jgi:P-type Ca2+ transporter type 2C
VSLSLGGKLISMPINNFNIQGLSQEAVSASRVKYGKNSVNYHHENTFWAALKGFLKDPMVILLFVASVIYFVSGQTGDGIFMLSAIVLVSGISLYQGTRSKNALRKLQDLTQPKSKVIRDGKIEEIKSEDLVIGDSLLVEEGTAISADGVIVHSNDFSVNESILTGESFAVEKDKTQKDNFIFQGTAVATGLAIATITAIGSETKLGKIGKSLQGISEEKTPLELQINDFVKKMAIVGAIIFVVVWGLNYYHSRVFMGSLLKALTLAMSILPEEIPMSLTTFMALGAWRMMKKGIVVKQMKTVETLGSATVICTDKTGTITENKMTLAKLFILKTNVITEAETVKNDDEKNLIRIAMWASEPMPFDPMEIALHDAYSKAFPTNERLQYSLNHEYPLGGTPPMMTHIFEDKSGHRIVATKGAVEALIKVCKLSKIEIQQINEAVKVLTSDGYRVLGVGESNFTGNNFPKTQQELSFVFKGIVAFYDPPKKNIHAVLNHFYEAGITVKIITGDNAETTKSIAKQVGFRGFEQSISGDELMKLSDSDLKKTVMNTQIFTRMFPDAKLKIINALKAQNQIVAMTGDGVNDGPALKAAHIGIAMGKKGTEIAKEAASLVLMNDDLVKMVIAVGMGRRIYTNLKKAIQFIISIHVPIILTVFIPLALGWIYPNIFSPLHIIFLELVMGPTCSIVYENEPMEKNAMTQAPRPFTSTFFSWKELSTSILRGLFITVGTLSIYQYSVQNAYNESLTRSMVFTTLITANVFLTLVNRSFYYSIFTTMKYKNNLVLWVIGITIGITGLLIYVHPFADFFAFEHLKISQLGICIGVGFVSVIWIELVKWRNRKIEITPKK